MRAGRGRRREGCPSELALHQVASNERGQDAALAGHVRDCPRCGPVVEGLRAVSVPAPDPAFWAAIAKRPARRRPRWQVVFGGALALGALGLVVAPRLLSPASSGVRVKGTLALGVVARRASGAVEHVGPGGSVAPGDTLRFEIAQAGAGHVVVLGLDARPSVSVYVPADGVTPAGQALLPAAIVADETPGAERIVALSCPSAPALEEVRAAATRALAAAAGDPTKVGALELPCLQASSVIMKAAVR